MTQGESWSAVATKEGWLTRQSAQAPCRSPGRRTFSTPDAGIGNGKPGTTKGEPDRAEELRAKGLKVSEIARAMGTSKRTVQRYLAA